MSQQTTPSPQGCCDSCEVVFDITEAEVERLKQPGAVLHCDKCTDPSLYHSDIDFYGYPPGENLDEQ